MPRVVPTRRRTRVACSRCRQRKQKCHPRDGMACLFCDLSGQAENCCFVRINSYPIHVDVPADSSPVHSQPDVFPHQEQPFPVAQTSQSLPSISQSVLLTPTNQLKNGQLPPIGSYWNASYTLPPQEQEEEQPQPHSQQQQHVPKSYTQVPLRSFLEEPWRPSPPCFSYQFGLHHHHQSAAATPTSQQDSLRQAVPPPVMEPFNLTTPFDLSPFPRPFAFYQSPAHHVAMPSHIYASRTPSEEPWQMGQFAAYQTGVPQC